MSKKKLTFFPLIIAPILILGMVLVNNVSAVCNWPSSCQYAATQTHVVDDFTCYDMDDPYDIYVYDIGMWSGNPADLVKNNLVNIDDHPNGVGGDNTLMPGESVIFYAPDTVRWSGARVMGTWLRMHDNEDSATYKLEVCDSIEMGQDCGAGWREVESEGVHTSGDPGKEVCSDNQKSSATNDGCPDPEPKVPDCGSWERMTWPCAISYDEHRWNDGCSLTNVKKVRYTFGGSVDNPWGHIHIHDFAWIIRLPDPSTCSVTPATATATGDSTGKSTFSVTTTGTYKGTAAYAGVNTIIQRQNGTALTSAQVDAVYPDIYYTYQEPTYGYYNYYLPSAAGCTSNRNVPCSKTFNLTLPAGDYNLYCEVVESASDASKCTGQPWCIFNGGPKDCFSLGYRDCGASDNAKRYVNLPCLTDKSLTCNYGATVTATGRLNSGFASHSADRYRFLHYNSSGTLLSSQENVWANTPLSKTFPNPIGTGLAMGTTYRWAVQARRPGDTAWSNQSCANTPFVCDNSSCMLTTFTPRHAVTPGLLQRGQTENVTVHAEPLNGTIVGIGVTEAGTVVSVSPASGVTEDLEFTVTGLASAAIGAGTTISVKATMNTGKTCELNSLYKITEYANWWKIVQGDVWTIGNVSSTIPAGSVFSDHIGTYTGFPGIPFYAENLGGNLDEDDAYISNKGWNADTGSFYGSALNALGYEYFWKLLPEDVQNNAQVLSSTVNSGVLDGGYEYPVGSGYKWFKRSGALEINNNANLDIGAKSIVFVDGNLTMNGRPVPSDGTGLFMVIVSGDININPTITQLRGIFVSDKTIYTGSAAGDDTDSTLNVGGTFIAWGKSGTGGVKLDRDLPTDSANAGEVFTYRPDLVLNIPKYFSEQTITRREVNP